MADDETAVRRRRSEDEVEGRQVVVDSGQATSAAEMLVPLEALRAEVDRPFDFDSAVARLARRFKVSSLVVIRRLHDVGKLTRERMWQEYRDELARLPAKGGKSGGDFYRTQAARVSKRFARALVVSTLEGTTMHRDAFHLLGFSKLATFRELGSRLGVI